MIKYNMKLPFPLMYVLVPTAVQSLMVFLMPNAICISVFQVELTKYKSIEENSITMNLAFTSQRDTKLDNLL